MATQDSGDFDFGKAALSVLSGAAAGAASSNIGTGFSAGLATVEQQRERERQRGIQDRQLQQRDVLAQQRIESGQLGIQEQRQRIQRRQEQEQLSGFQQELGMISKLSEQNRIRYQKEYSAKATRPIQTDGAITYGLDEDRTELIDSHTRASKTLSNVDSYIFSLERSLSSNNPAEKKAAERMSRLLGAELGYQYMPATDGRPEQIKTPHGNFPVEFASARKIKDLAEADVEANRKNYEHHNRTRSQTGYAAQRTMYRGMETMPDLSPNEAGRIAQGYQNAVQGNDFLDRNLTLAHGMDRILKGKDPNQSQMELVHLTNVLDKANVQYRVDPNGEFLIDAGGFNKYVNRYNGLTQKVGVLEKTGFVEVNEELVQKIYNRSGLNQLKDDWLGQASSMNARNNLAKREAAGFKQEVATGEQIRKAQVGSQIEDAKRQRQIQSLSPKVPIEETVSQYRINTPDGEITLSPSAQRGVMINAQNRVKNTIESGARKQFKSRYGSSPEEFLNQAITDDNADKISKAQRWWDRRKFDLEKHKSSIDREARVFLRELRNPSTFSDFQTAIGAKQNGEAATNGFEQAADKPQSFESEAQSTVSRLIKKVQ